jgi:3-deoxy-manno-octulosonate cytidylyltransferase (CMP-KDO synthetase)
MLQKANSVLGVIPARLASTRLPRKVLRSIAGLPMIEWVYQAAKSCKKLDEVVIATDSDEVLNLARTRGWNAMLTSASCASGSDRVFEVSRSIPAKIYVNIQGDEPLLRPEHIDALLRPFTREVVQVSTLATPCRPEEIHNPNVVKVVTAPDGRALYFSRSAIPYDRDNSGFVCKKHLGLYAYRSDALEIFAKLPPSSLELTERLEQLRFLENGINVFVEETPYDTVGVDTEEDLAAVEALLRDGTHVVEEHQP